MIYCAENPVDAERAKKRLEWLLKKGKRFQITEKRPTRSISQNSYLHLILSWYAFEYGETLEYIKQEVFKKVVNPEIFKTEYVNKITGECRDAWRSTADLDKAELTSAIDRFRNYSVKEAGIFLPEPSDLASIDAMNIELQKQQNYQFT